MNAKPRGFASPDGAATTSAAPDSPNRDSQSLTADLDRYIWHALARTTRGASPIALGTAWFDWLSHWAISPGLRTSLALEAQAFALEQWRQYWSASSAPERLTASDLAELSRDRLSTLGDVHDAWAAWLTQAVARPAGVSRLHAERVSFSIRQALEAFNPRNFLLTNPEAMSTTFSESGANLMRGLGYFYEDMARTVRKEHGTPAPDAASAVGKTLATTPGKVVYRNRLIELIQYEATTSQVHREPILITPAWIMKYYILDLTAQNSLVKYLVDNGFTVFLISWRNPGAEERDLSFDDYRRLGVLAALDAISALLPGIPVHGLGYCLGGTLLSVTAAGLARDGDDCLASLTLLAAQTDFSEPGELAVFIDEAQLAALDAGMEASGYLGGEQMAAAFALLRSRDLIWRRMQTQYLLGQRGEQIDLVTWNEDVTRMPYRMHSEYLRHFFLNNDFVEGRLHLDGRPAAVSDIRAPIFALGTTKDHVAPWRSVFKIHLFADTDVTFALTNGGHNAGVVSPPGHPRRTHWIATALDGDHYVAPDRWKELAEERQGSWWPSWLAWLTERSTGKRKPKSIRRADTGSNQIAASEPLTVAPGDYVRS